MRRSFRVVGNRQLYVFGLALRVGLIAGAVMGGIASKLMVMGRDMAIAGLRPELRGGYDASVYYGGGYNPYRYGYAVRRVYCPASAYMVDRVTMAAGIGGGLR